MVPSLAHPGRQKFVQGIHSHLINTTLLACFFFIFDDLTWVSGYQK